MTGIIEQMRGVVFKIVGNDLLARKIVRALLRTIGGHQIYLPGKDYKVRNKEIKDLYRSGVKVHQLAKRYGLHNKTIARIIRGSNEKQKR